MRTDKTRYWLWPLLAAPAVALIVGTLTSDEADAFKNALHPTGEFSARLLIAALLATPLKILLEGWRGPRWMVRNRRAIGVASFGYAALHLAFYLADRHSLSKILMEIGDVKIATGWISIAILMVLAATSNNFAMRWLGHWWKPVQRATYVAAFFAAIHWAATNHWGGEHLMIIHFLPLIGLSAYRLWSTRLRPLSPPDS